MEDGEGSVFVDGEDAEMDQESTSENSESTENVNNQSEDNSEENSTDGTANTEGTENTEGDKTEGEGEKPDLTEKGTKADPDPLSRANQDRANAQAEARRYQDLLNDPVRLEAYVQELKAERGMAKPADNKSEETPELDPSKLETVEDLQNFAKNLKEQSKKEIENIRKEVTGLTSSQQQKELSGRIQTDITQVQSKYPELREFNPDGSKNPEYNEELDVLIGETYNDLDLDKRTGLYRGRVSPLAIADKIMGAKRIGEGSGSRKAQTQVIDKRNGRVITSQTNSGAQRTDESKLSPAATIADRMRRAAERRK